MLFLRVQYAPKCFSTVDYIIKIDGESESFSKKTVYNEPFRSNSRLNIKNTSFLLFSYVQHVPNLL